ncbi:MAG: hypothetical protein ABFS43_11935 [Thermodesulfobacteriota bacterium]
MKQINPLITILLLLTFLSCAPLEIKQEEIDPWLISISGNQQAEINVEGIWHDPDSLTAKGFIFTGWGKGHIYQDGNKLSGAIGSYNVRGIVSVKTVFLVFYSGGSVYYTARMEMVEKGVLEGQYFDADDREQKAGYPTKLLIK